MLKEQRPECSSLRNARASNESVTRSLHSRSKALFGKFQRSWALWSNWESPNPKGRRLWLKTYWAMEKPFLHIGVSDFFPNYWGQPWLSGLWLSWAWLLHLGSSREAAGWRMGVNWYAYPYNWMLKRTSNQFFSPLGSKSQPLKIPWPVCFFTFSLQRNKKLCFSHSRFDPGSSSTPPALLSGPP